MILYVKARMELLPFEMTWMILSRMPISDILCYRAVSRLAMHAVDKTDQNQWRDLYHKTVCPWLKQSLTFDWKKACMHAGSSRGLPAVCTWNLKEVYVIVPWVDINDCTVIGTPVQLRDGVKTVSTISNAIDYVYYGAFRLRSVTHSCHHWADVQPCYNCAAKKTCMRMRKRYYIRNIAPLDNEMLARLLTAAPNRT